MSTTARLVRHFPAVAAFATTWGSTKSSSGCEAPKNDKKAFGMVADAEGDFHNLFPKRQLWQPKMEYPLWDKNWDDRVPASTGDAEKDHLQMRQLRKNGVTRHIILVRHGQYIETEQEDSKKVLTELGRQQADLTGKRLKEMLEGANKEFGPCNIKVVRVSTMARAKETADIIASHLPAVERSEPDPGFNEGRPAHNVPGGKASTSTIQKTDEHHPRLEGAFRQLFYRAEPPTEDDEANDEDRPKHEFEILVCHANVIRYFLCRYV
jgi:serine/threonine-protein phosphatase PGAM5